MEIVISGFKVLRQSFVDQWERFGKQAQSNANAQASARQADLAKEINQLLRVHRPRIRRVESENFEKRALELAQNKSKFDRYLLRLNQLIESNQTSFTSSLNETERFIENYVESASKFLDTTKDGSISMTNLQAIQKRLKETNLNASTQLELMQQNLSKISNDLVQKSSLAESSFIESCKLIKEFVKPSTTIKTVGTTDVGTSKTKSSDEINETPIDQGGTYHPVELEYYKTEAVIAIKAVQKILDQRKESLESLKGRIESILNLKTYDETFHVAIEDLCMMQGLGRIYGAPKMKATIHLREEFLSSENQQQHLLTNFENLKTLLTPQITKHNQTNESSVSSQLIFYLNSIRVEGLVRCKYLSLLVRNIPLTSLISQLPDDIASPFLSSPYVVEASSMLTEVSSTNATTNDKKAPSKDKDPKKDVSASAIVNKAVTSFLDQAQLIQRIARTEMNTLYSAYWSTNGTRLVQLGRTKPDFKLTDPENCVVPSAFIDRMSAEQVRAKQNYLNYCKEFKGFLENLEATLPLIPHVVFADLLNRTQTSASQASVSLTKEFTAIFRTYQEQQAKNKTLLKPSFVSPDSKPALETLCNEEETRFQKSRALINNHRHNLLQNQLTHADLFSRRILFFSKNLMTIFDTTVSTTDITVVEEESEEKQKSLKRSMRQYMRLVAAEKDKEMYDPRNRYLTKTWPGVSLRFEVPIEMTPSEPVVETVKDKGKKDAKSAPQEVKKVDSCPSMTGFKIEPNREIIKERNQAIAAYTAFFQANVSEAIELTCRYLQDEENWRGMLEKLTAV